MTAIVDYGVGNLFSLKCSFNAINEEAVVTSDIEVIRSADRVILPGVGAFEDAAGKLKSTGMDRAVKEIAAGGKPLMGICLGMQLLFDRSFEYGEHEGLGLIPGSVRSLDGAIDSSLKIPHMGWNALKITEPGCKLFKNIKDGDCVYFVHSYYACECAEHTAAVADYSVPVTAVVHRGNIYGCQFHPEKSGKTGLDILRAFAGLKEGEC